MAWPPMDPLYEQRLREDVIYLHSLWHQGPPRVSSVAASFPDLRHRRRHHLQPVKATQFKKGKKQPVKGSTSQPSNSSPGPEWTVPAPPPPQPADVWPDFVAKPGRQPIKFSPEEQLKLDTKNAQRRALKVVAEYLRCGDAGDDSDLTGSSTDEDEDFMDGDDGREEYSFFYSVFKEDKDLSEYYEKNFARGEFVCLVCGAIGGKKAGKKYKGCFPLVQHSINIANTKKKIAHRSFGQAVCKILSWDINELSTVVSLLARGSNSGENKENCLPVPNNVVSVQGDAVEGKHEEAVQEIGSIGTGILPSGDEGDMGNNSAENKESFLPVPNNVVSVQGDAVEGKPEEAVQEIGSIGTGILPTGDEGDMGTGVGDDKDTPSSTTHHVSTMETDAIKDKNGETAPKSGVIGARDMPNDDGDMGINIGENKESPSPCPANVFTVEGDAVKGKNAEVLPENTAMGQGSSSPGNGNGGDTVPFDENSGDAGNEMHDGERDNDE